MKTPKILSKTIGSELNEFSENSMKKYDEYLSNDFPRQMVSFQSIAIS